MEHVVTASKFVSLATIIISGRSWAWALFKNKNFSYGEFLFSFYSF